MLRLSHHRIRCDRPTWGKADAGLRRPAEFLPHVQELEVRRVMAPRRAFALEHDQLHGEPRSKRIGDHRQLGRVDLVSPPLIVDVAQEYLLLAQLGDEVDIAPVACRCRSGCARLRSSRHGKGSNKN